MAAYKLAIGGVMRRSDGAFIPQDDDNADWRAYVLWRDGGSATLMGGTTVTVPPGGPPDPLYTAAEQAELDAEATEVQNLATTKADTLVTLLAGSTPTQIDTYFTNNVTTQAQAITVLKALAKVCAVLARRM